MIKKLSLTLLTILGAIALLFAYRFSQNLTPESILKQLFDMNAPTRFAFISDQETKKLAVINIEENQQVGLLDLQMPAKVMAIEKSTGTLAYSDGKQKVILHNLTSHTERAIFFSHPVEKIIFTSYSELVVIGKKEISIFHLAEKTTGNNTFPQHADIVSAVFSPLNQSLSLLERSPSFVKINIENNRYARVFLPKFLHHLGTLAVSPDGNLSLFGGQKDGKNFAVLFEGESIEKTFPLSAPLVQPYIDQKSQYLIMIDRSGKGWVVNEKKHPMIDEERAIDVGMAVSGYASVFLDRKLLVVGKEIKLFQLSDLTLLDQKKLEQPVQSLFVHGNSKTVLLGSAQAPLVYLYNSGDQSLQKMALNGIKSASLIVMGASNTICH